MKPIDVTDDSYAEYNEDFNKKDSKFKAGDHVRISKYKNIKYKNIKAYILYMSLIGQKKFLQFVGLKMQFRGLMLLVT